MSKKYVVVNGVTLKCQFNIDFLTGLQGLLGIRSTGV